MNRENNICLKRMYKILLSIAIISSFISCKSENRNVIFDSEELLSFNVNTIENKEYIINLSDLMESVDIIRMDNSTEEAFTKIFKVAVSENYFATNQVDTPVKLFLRKDGTFLGNIGKPGQGPGEYFLIWEVIIDESRERIYLANYGENYIYSYDLNGNFHEDETIYYPKDVLSRFSSIYLNNIEDKIIVFQTPFAAWNRGKTHLETVENACWVQDFKGNVVHNIPSERYRIPRNPSTIWTSHINEDSPIYSYGIDALYNCRTDTTYHYNASTNEMYPVYTTNMPAAELTLVMSRETPLHYYTLQQKYRDGTEINPEYSIGHKLLQVNKQTKEGRYIRIMNDYLGGIEINRINWFLDIKDDHVVVYYEPLELKELLEEALDSNKEMDSKVRTRATKLKNSLKENDNNIMMICKFKKQ